MPGSGPRALRAAAYDPGTYHLDLGLEIFDWLDVVDAGDALLPARPDRAARTATSTPRSPTSLNAGAFPVVIGGDHSIT